MIETTRMVTKMVTNPVVLEQKNKMSSMYFRYSAIKGRNPSFEQT